MLKKCQKNTCFTNEKHEADDDRLPPSLTRVSVQNVRVVPGDV